MLKKKKIKIKLSGLFHFIFLCFLCVCELKIEACECWLLTMPTRRQTTNEKRPNEIVLTLYQYFQKWCWNAKLNASLFLLLMPLFLAQTEGKNTISKWMNTHFLFMRAHKNQYFTLKQNAWMPECLQCLSAVMTKNRENTFTEKERESARNWI